MVDPAELARRTGAQRAAEAMRKQPRSLAIATAASGADRTAELARLLARWIDEDAADLAAATQSGSV